MRPAVLACSVLRLLGMHLAITLFVFSAIGTSINVFVGGSRFCQADEPVVEQLTPEESNSDSRVRRAELAARQARLRQYASDIALAQLCWQQGRLDRAVALLQRHRPLADGEDLRGIEWHLLWRQMHAEEKVFGGRANPVRALAFLPDDSAVVASDASHTYATAGEIREWSLSANSANSMIYRQSSPKPATANYYSGFRSLALAPDGLSVAVPDGSKLQVVDRKTRRVKWTAQGHNDFVMAVAYSPDGRILASGGLDKVVKLWDSDSGKLIATLADHEWGVLTLAFSPDGRTLAAGCGDDRAPDWSRRTHGELRLWDVPTNRLSRTIPVTSSVGSVDYSSDGRWLAVGMFDGSLVVVDTRDHRTTRIEAPSSSPINCVRFSPDATSLASASADGRVRLWEAGSGSEIATYRGHRGSVDCLAFSHDGQTLASGGSDCSVRLWDTQVYPDRTRVHLPAMSLHTVTFTADSQTLITSDYHHVWRIDAMTNQVHSSWATEHWTQTMALSPDGTLLATAGQRDTKGGGGPMLQLWNVQLAAPIRDITVELAAVDRVAFSPNGHLIMARCSGDKRSPSITGVWLVDSGQCIGTWNDSHGVVFSPDSRWLAAIDSDQIELFDIEMQQSMATLRSDAAQVLAIQFSPDGSHLASAWDDHSVNIWNVETRQIISTLRGHKGRVERLLFSPDGQGLLTSGPSETQFWNLAGNTLRFTIPHGNCPLAFTPDGRTLISAPDEVYFWQVATGDELLVYPRYGYDSRSLAVSSDGNSVAHAGGNRDETAGVWLWQTRRHPLAKRSEVDGVPD